MDEFQESTRIVSEKLFQILLKELKELVIEEEIYCLNIVYGSEDIFPPLYAFGLVKDKLAWRKNQSTELKWLMWNIAEYPLSPYGEISPVLDSDTELLFEKYNRDTDKLESWSIAKKALLNVAKKLKNQIDLFNFNKSDDFIIVVTDLEQVDVLKNFKAVNPELLKDFKDVLF